LAAAVLVAAALGIAVASAIPYQVVVVYLPYERVPEEHVVHWTGVSPSQPPPDPPAPSEAPQLAPGFRIPVSSLIPL